MRTIFAISDDLLALGRILEEAGGDVSHPDAIAALDAWEAELASDIEEKADSYAALISEFEARSEARIAEANRIKARADADRRAADSLRERLRIVWEARGLGKIQTARYVIALARNGGLAPLEIRGDVPERFTKVKVEPDRDAIRAALLAGEPLDFASLGERGTRISIR
jgi:hypothetical protein